MKRYVSAVASGSSILFGNIVSCLNPYDRISIQNDAGVIYEGRFSDFRGLDDYDLLTDPDGYEWEVHMIYDSPVTLLRPSKYCLIIGIDLSV